MPNAGVHTRVMHKLVYTLVWCTSWCNTRVVHKFRKRRRRCSPMFCSSCNPERHRKALIKLPARRFSSSPLTHLQGLLMFLRLALNSDTSASASWLLRSVVCTTPSRSNLFIFLISLCRWLCGAGQWLCQATALSTGVPFTDHSEDPRALSRCHVLCRKRLEWKELRPKAGFSSVLTNLHQTTGVGTQVYFDKLPYEDG